jgi:hypothetical protein
MRTEKSRLRRSLMSLQERMRQIRQSIRRPDSVANNLTLTMLPEKPVLVRIVASGTFPSYPAWIRARGRE